MNKNITLLFFIIGIVLISCNPTPEKKTRKLTYYHYYLSWNPNLKNGILKTKLDLYMDTIMENGKTNYIYRDSLIGGDTLTIHYYIKNDSLFFYELYCKIIDTIQFDFNNKSINLYQSDFDEDSSYDEESDIYWNNDYGIVGVYNYTGPLELFDHDSIKTFATTDLYKFIINKIRERIPPIPEKNRDLK